MVAHFVEGGAGGLIAAVDHALVVYLDSNFAEVALEGFVPGQYFYNVYYGRVPFKKS